MLLCRELQNRCEDLKYIIATSRWFQWNTSLKYLLKNRLPYCFSMTIPSSDFFFLFQHFFWFEHFSIHNEKMFPLVFFCIQQSSNWFTKQVFSSNYKPPRIVTPFGIRTFIVYCTAFCLHAKEIMNIGIDCEMRRRECYKHKTFLLFKLISLFQYFMTFLIMLPNSIEIKLNAFAFLFVTRQMSIKRNS